MKENRNEIIDNALLDLCKLDMSFTSKPIIVGGLAMEYYGFRKKGSDVDLIITNEDYQTLIKKYPENRKDVWGDLGLLVDDYEMFRSIWKFDYSFYTIDAIEYDNYKVVSIDKLFLMKTLAMSAEEKHKRDFDLIMNYYQNPVYAKYMNDHIEKYLAAPKGIIYNSDF